MRPPAYEGSSHDVLDSEVEKTEKAHIVASQRRVYNGLYASEERFSLAAYPMSFLDMRIRRARQLLPADPSVLDLGCGSGSLVLRQHGFPSRCYVGIDLSWVGLARANKALGARHSHCRFAQGHVELLPFREESFEGLFAISVIEHLPDPAGFLKDCARVLKRRGLLVLRTPNPENLLTADGFLRLFFPRVYARRNSAVGHDHRRFIAPNAMRHLLRQHGFREPSTVYYTDTLVEWLWEHLVSPLMFTFVRRIAHARREYGDGVVDEVNGQFALGSGVRLYNSMVFPILRLLCWPDRLIELTGQSGGYFTITRRW